jgi:glycosyltransferase involved in cell wall biosynthesis
MNETSVSVVIPAYNAAGTLGRAIDSVLNQAVPIHEIIVVDDGSSDGSADVARAYGTSVKVIQQANSQTAAARNRGIEEATGTFIGFLDADDFWEPQKIECQLAIFAKHTNVAVVGGRFYSQLPGAARRVHEIRSDRFYDQPLRCSGSQAFMIGTMLWTGMVLVRRSALQTERFFPGLEPAEDRDLWVRLAAKHVVYLDSQPLATAVLEPDGISRSNIADDCTKMLKVIDRNQSMLGVPSRMLWKSYVRYRWAAVDPSPSASLPLLFKSFACWPLRLTLPSMKPFGLLKRLLYLLKQSLAGLGQSKGVSP